MPFGVFPGGPTDESPIARAVREHAELDEDALFSEDGARRSRPAPDGEVSGRDRRLFEELRRAVERRELARYRPQTPEHVRMAEVVIHNLKNARQQKQTQAIVTLQRAFRRKLASTERGKATQRSIVLMQFTTHRELMTAAGSASFKAKAKFWKKSTYEQLIAAVKEFHSPRSINNHSYFLLCLAHVNLLISVWHSRNPLRRTAAEGSAAAKRRRALDELRAKVRRSVSLLAGVPVVDTDQWLMDQVKSLEHDPHSRNAVPVGKWVERATYVGDALSALNAPLTMFVRGDEIAATVNQPLVADILWEPVLHSGETLTEVGEVLTTVTDILGPALAGIGVVENAYRGHKARKMSLELGTTFELSRPLRPGELSEEEKLAMQEDFLCLLPKAFFRKWGGAIRTIDGERTEYFILAELEDKAVQEYRQALRRRKRTILSVVVLTCSIAGLFAAGPAGLIVGAVGFGAMAYKLHDSATKSWVPKVRRYRGETARIEHNTDLAQRMIVKARSNDPVAKHLLKTLGINPKQSGAAVKLASNLRDRPLASGPQSVEVRDSMS